jgi:hypothetical protein
MVPHISLADFVAYTRSLLLPVLLAHVSRTVVGGRKVSSPALNEYPDIQSAGQDVSRMVTLSARG